MLNKFLPNNFFKFTLYIYTFPILGLALLSVHFDALGLIVKRKIVVSPVR